MAQEKDNVDAEEKEAASENTETAESAPEKENFSADFTSDANDKQDDSVSDASTESNTDSTDTGSSEETSGSERTEPLKSNDEDATNDDGHTQKDNDRTVPVRDHVVASEQVAEEESKEKKSKKKTIIIILLSLFLVACIGTIGYLLYQSSQSNSPSNDNGATITSYENKSREEIQADLDRRVQESRMTISVNAQAQLKDGKVRVNVVNDEGNKFSQSFTLKQDDKTLYESGIIEPGKTVEYCDAPDAHAGTAVVTIQAHNKETGDASGNPQSVEINIVDSGSDN